MFLCVKAENLGYNRRRCFSILQVGKCIYNVIIAYLETVKFTGKESVRLMLRSLLLLMFNFPPLPPLPGVPNILRVAHNMRPEMHSGHYVK